MCATPSISFYRGSGIDPHALCWKPIPIAQDAPTFYQYDTPIRYSSNSVPRLSRSNKLVFAPVQDDQNRTSLIILGDTYQPIDSNGGHIDLEIQQITGIGEPEALAVDITVKDDPGDSYTWNAATGVGAIGWEWASSYMDGGVFGVLPTRIGTNQFPPTEFCYRFTLNANTLEGIDGAILMVWDTTTQQIIEHPLSFPAGYNYLQFMMCSKCLDPYPKPSDCRGVVHGTWTRDACGECRAPFDPDRDSTCSDCAGVPNGNATLLECGCNDNTSCIDCLGIPNGNAQLEVCGCNDVTSCLDCLGNPNGNAQVLACGCNDNATCRGKFIVE